MDGDNDPDVLYVTSHFLRISWNENFIGNGCTDSLACNYDPDSYVDDGSCCFGICGCIDLNALNFDSVAECDDGSCDYRILGRVFYDDNSDGNFNEDDYGLAFQEITTSNGQIYLTNDDGEFYVDFSSEFVSIALTENELFPVNTTPNPQIFEDGVNQNSGSFDLQFGVNSVIPDHGICVDFILLVPGILAMIM